jgi:hypothetical protein
MVLIRREFEIHGFRQISANAFPVQETESIIELSQRIILIDHTFAIFGSPGRIDWSTPTLCQGGRCLSTGRV